MLRTQGQLETEFRERAAAMLARSSGIAGSHLAIFEDPQGNIIEILHGGAFKFLQRKVEQRIRDAYKGNSARPPYLVGVVEKNLRIPRCCPPSSNYSFESTSHRPRSTSLFDEDPLDFDLPPSGYGSGIRFF
jgi:hypothetical protein